MEIETTNHKDYDSLRPGNILDIQGPSDQHELIPRDEEEIIPEKRYSSSEVIIAAEEIKFRQHEAQQKAQRVVQEKGEAGKVEAQTELRKAYTTLAHSMDKPELEKEYNVKFDKGLTTDEIEKKHGIYGYNELTPPVRDPWWLRLVKNIFGGLFNVLLWVGAILCIIAYSVDKNKDPTNIYLTIVLALLPTLTGCFTYYQQGKASDLMEGLSKMMPADIIVLRNGHKEPVQPKLLVPGDIIDLNYGMQIPADIRVIDCSPDMEVDNSSLTGESEPQKRDWRKSDKIPAEAANLAFFGTLLLRGKGIGLVIATGDNTYMGRTAQLASTTETVDTPIRKEINAFIKKISFIAIALGVIFFIIGMFDTGLWINNIIFLIGIIVANVPEGLLATVTVSLTLTARKMYSRNVQVKNLEAVEALGSTSVICSDKTGTLTTNIMTVQNVYFSNHIVECDTVSPMEALEGDFYGKDNKTRYPEFLKLVRCLALCNNAEFLQDGTIDKKANATEAAMLKFAHGHINAEYALTVHRYRNHHKKLHEIPFNSTNKWQLSVHEIIRKYAITDDEKKIDDNIKQPLLTIKGAPEKILDLCSSYFINEQVLPLTDDIKKQIMDGVLELGGKGERVIACADLLLDHNLYNINLEEPIAAPCSNLKDLNYDNEENTVYVDRNNQKHKIEFTYNSIATDQLLNTNFSNTTIGHLMKILETKFGLPFAMQRLYFSDKGLLDPESTFKDLGIECGHILYLHEGPYKFSGTEPSDCNFPFGNNENNGNNGFTFLGLTSLIDPPRPGVPEAVHKCQQAGIKVIMVTGDHPVTAKAIAEKVGIIGKNSQTKEDIANSKYGGDISKVQEDEYNAIVVPGWELQENLDKDKFAVAEFWNRVLNKNNVVFARTSPQQKLLIVTAVQERGGIVAVTGDGVNDSPALKKADIGIAMGITGTEVAKEAADMILLDDNFASIVNGIEQGRIVFDNLKKSIAYTLQSNVPEIFPFLINQVLGIPLPLTVIQILLVDLGTDMAPAVSFAFEQKESDIMKRKPRDPEHDRLVTWKLMFFSYGQIGIFESFGSMYVFFIVMSYFGFKPLSLINLDRDHIFAYTPTTYYDAYYLYCFDEDYASKCHYFPDFESTLTEHYYNEWLKNDQGFAKKSRALIKKKFGVDFKDLSYEESKSFWINEVLPSWSGETDGKIKLYTTDLYPNRPCSDTDNKNEQILSKYCPSSRTGYGAYSLFPMNAKDRTEALYTANGACFASIVMLQIVGIMVCKTRVRSLFEQGMNCHFMNFAILTELLLVNFLLYEPIANNIVGTRPLRFVWFLGAIPFQISIIVYDEMRKGWIRKHRYGWVERSTYW